MTFEVCGCDPRRTTALSDSDSNDHTHPGENIYLYVVLTVSCGG